MFEQYGFISTFVIALCAPLQHAERSNGLSNSQFNQETNALGNKKACILLCIVKVHTHYICSIDVLTLSVASSVYCVLRIRSCTDICFSLQLLVYSLLVSCHMSTALCVEMCYCFLCIQLLSEGLVNTETIKLLLNLILHHHTHRVTLTIQSTYYLGKTNQCCTDPAGSHIINTPFGPVKQFIFLWEKIHISEFSYYQKQKSVLCFELSVSAFDVCFVFLYILNIGVKVEALK